MSSESDGYPEILPVDGLHGMMKWARGNTDLRLQRIF
jgi:hypothetical protein